VPAGCHPAGTKSSFEVRGNVTDVSQSTQNSLILHRNPTIRFARQRLARLYSLMWKGLSLLEQFKRTIFINE